MGHSQSSINQKKSYYSVEYLNADFESELNKMIQNNHKSDQMTKTDQTTLYTSIYETLNVPEPNKYQCLISDDLKSTKNFSSSQDLSFSSDENDTGVKRSKSFAKPENRVLPPLFQKKQLRQTNLLKTDGSKKTWRNSSKLKKSNSTILQGDTIIKPSLIKSLLNKSISNLNKEYDLDSLNSLDQDVNLVGKMKKENKMIKSDKDIRIISRFPINSKVYRHYISGKRDTNFDKFTNCVDVSGVLNNMQVKKDPDPTYDSINDFKSKKSTSSFSLTSSSSTFSSITKSSDLFYNMDKKISDSTNESSIFSALTSSSIVNSSHSLKNHKRYVSSINITCNSIPVFQSDYNNNFNTYINDKNNGIETGRGSIKSINQSNYDYLSNAKSGILKRSVSTKILPNEETRRLNEIFHNEIQRAYEERSKRFEHTKEVLDSKPGHLINLKKNPTVRCVDIQSKIKAIEENIMKQDFKQSKQSAFKKIEPRKSLIKKDTIKKEIPNFYLRPPANYDDEPLFNNQQEQEVKIDLFKSHPDSNIKFIEIVNCKRQKYKFIPDKVDEKKDDDYYLSFFDTPPPPPEYNDDYGFLHSSDSSSDSDIIQANTKSNGNFILKPKESDITKLRDKEMIPGVILVESQNSKQMNTNNINRSFCKGRRKGLEEVFPEIKLTKQREYENISKLDTEWCPASDLNDFDLEDSDYESNYHLSLINDNPNYVIRGANFRKDLFKKNLFLENLQSDRNEQELNQIFEQPVKRKNVCQKFEYADIVNSIENFYY